MLRTINGKDKDEAREMKEWARSLGWTGRIYKPENNPLYINEPWLIDRSQAVMNSVSKEPEPAEDNVRVDGKIR